MGRDAVLLFLHGRVQRLAPAQGRGEIEERFAQPAARQLAAQRAEPRPQRQPGPGQAGNLVGQPPRLLGRECSLRIDLFSRIRHRTTF